MTTTSYPGSLLPKRKDPGYEVVMTIAFYYRRKPSPCMGETHERKLSLLGRVDKVLLDDVK
jgi:hypothetical protein